MRDGQADRGFEAPHHCGMPTTFVGHIDDVRVFGTFSKNMMPLI
jgi:hypothetical protein